MSAPGQETGEDIEALRQLMRRRRLAWAQGSAAGAWVPELQQSGPPADRRGEEVPPLSGSDWSVDVDLIERRRIVRGWSRLQLATAAHVDPKTLRDLLGRRRRPNLGTVQAVSHTLELSLTDVIRFTQGAPVNLS